MKQNLECGIIEWRQTLKYVNCLVTASEKSTKYTKPIKTKEKKKTKQFKCSSIQMCVCVSLFNLGGLWI